MDNEVSVRQAVEGRKIQIWLSPENVQDLVAGDTVELLPSENVDWEDPLTQRNSQGQPLSIAQILIQKIQPIA